MSDEATVAALATAVDGPKANGPISPRQLSAEDILALGSADLDFEVVQVPEWRGSVILRVLPADVGLELNEKMQALPKEKQHESIFLLLGACLVKPDGSPLFTHEQLVGLRKRSQKVLIRLQKVALGLQGWLDEGTPAKNA
jgi:hypothetical protein